jgi:hypothetical protein
MNKILRGHYWMIFRSHESKEAPIACNGRISEMVDIQNDKLLENPLLAELFVTKNSFAA